MGKPVKKAESATSEKPKATRKMLTPAERIAKAQADLEALKVKAAESAKAKLSAAEAVLAKAKDAQTKANEKVAAAEATVTELNRLVNGDTDTSDQD